MKQHKALVKKQGQSKLVLTSDQHPITNSNFSKAALKTCDVLQKHGFSAYLVGGCIRDLLLGIKPKDFDIATNATPEKVHNIFSSSRIIGRRFKIVHVLYGNEIIEVTTFRSNEQTKSRRGTTVSDGHGMLVRDNSYGQDIDEDCNRRDFTINAIYYDPKDGTLTDFHGGLYDLKHGIIDIIGDPEVRYAEDPVRIIRAIRFKAKLGFKLSKRTEDPIAKQKSLLINISNARMFEEVNKLFLSGHGQASLNELIDYDLLRLLMPGQRSVVTDSEFHDFVSYALESSDARTARGQMNKPYFLYAVLLFTKVRSILEQQSASLGSITYPEELVVQTAQQVLNIQNAATDIPSAIYYDISSLYVLYFSLFSPFITQEELEKITSNSRFRASYDLLKLRAHFEPSLEPYVEFYKPYYDESALKAETLRQKKIAKRNEKRQQKRDAMNAFKKDAQSKNEKKAKSESFSKDSAQDRQERLAKARAWRIAMNLDP